VTVKESILRASRIQ